MRLSHDARRHLLTPMMKPIAFAAALCTLIYALPGKAAPAPSGTTATESGDPKSATADAIQKAISELQKSMSEKNQSDVERVRSEAKLEAANKETALAKKETAAAKKDAEDASASVADLKAGKLMSFGLAAGVAAAAIIPVERGGFTFNDGAQIVGMPYVAAFPAYLRTPEPVRQYCAQTFVDNGVDAAQKAASAATQKRARTTLKGLYASLKSGTVGKYCQEEGDKNACSRYGIDNKYSNLIEQADALNPDSDDAAEKKKVDEWVMALAETWWISGVPGRCFWKRVGFFVGVPLNASFNVTTFGATTSTDRDLSGRISFGLALAPNSLFQLLAGPAYGRITLPAATSGGAERTVGVWSVMVGIGGSLDLLTAITRQ